MSFWVSRSSKRPRIGVDFHVWDGIFQGSRSHLLGVYRSAIKMAPELDFYFFLSGIDSLRNEYAEFCLPNVFLIKTARASSVFRLALQLPWLQLRYQIDILHMQYRLPFFRVGACACTIHDILFETHPIFFKSSFVFQSRITYRYAAKRAKILLTVSEFSKSQIVDLYRIESSKIHVTSNAVDHNVFFPKSGFKNDVVPYGLVSGRYIISVGRLEPRKNHATLIDAYATLEGDVPDLVIVGQRDYSYGQVFEAIKHHNISSRVHILESVSDYDLPVLMRNALLFVYPAFAEGFGMPVVEAMASGVPVVASNTTSLPEVTGGAAVLIDPTSALELSRALAKLLNEKDLQQTMVVSGLKVARGFSWDNSARVLITSFGNYLCLERI